MPRGVRHDDGAAKERGTRRDAGSISQAETHSRHRRDRAPEVTAARVGRREVNRTR